MHVLPQACRATHCTQSCNDDVTAWLLQALRSGVINAEDSYRFEVPSSYREVGVANIQSGNFCMVLLFASCMFRQITVWLPLPEHIYNHSTMSSQPNCAEPWTEVIFADDKEGKIQVECCLFTSLTGPVT